MQEIAMLGAVAPVATSTSNKTAVKSTEQDFDRVFTDKQQAAADRASGAESARKTGRVANQSQQQADPEDSVAADGNAASAQETVAAESVADTPELSEVDAAEADGVDADAAGVQQTLIALMQSLSSNEPEADASEELTALVSDLVEQLETTDLHGEEVLAGIDLSQLKDQIDELSGAENGAEELAALVSQITEQLQHLTEGSGAAELAQGLRQDAGTMPQARDLLQQVLGSTSDDGLPLGGDMTDLAAVEMTSEDAETVDPRFAGLLNIRQGEQNSRENGLRNQAQKMQLQGQNQVPGSGEITAETPAEVTVDGADGLEKQLAAELAKATAALTGEATSQAQQTRAGVDGVAHQGAQLQTPQGSMFADGLKNMVTPATIQLPSGQQVAESQIFDQVVTHISGSVNGESGRMILRLNPAELGSLKLDVVVDGDEVRANIHAQSQQVQEVIERNLPQLRSALAEQGLKIEQFQVDIDKQQSDGSFQSFADQQQQNNRRTWNYEDVAEEDLVPVTQLFQPAGGGLSLRV